MATKTTKKTARKQPLGHIDPARPPKAGTVFVLEVPDGEENPTGGGWPIGSVSSSAASRARTRRS